LDPDEIFVLLDDCGARPQAASSRLFTGFVQECRSTDPQTLDTLWPEVDAALAAGLHAAVLIDYEWGAKLLQAGHQGLRADGPGSLRVLLFRECALLCEPQVSQWLAYRSGAPSPGPAGISGLQPAIGRADFEAGVARIQDHIRAGDTYQVNYTYRLHGQQFGSPVDLYRRLRSLQPVAYGALIALPACAAEPQWVLSCSPELFLRKQAGTLTAQPMKGTAARTGGGMADLTEAQWLAADPKNRAENVMIVDLLRNDLARIAELGSVTVPHLFAVETLQTVHQMTSTVQARLRQTLRFPDVLRALFPCGSITGAPKLHTMGIIAGLETAPRGLYCGAIGWLQAAAAQESCGDFCLSVAIRTLALGAADQGLRPATLGVGSGIVIDSSGADEFEETQVKTRFLTQVDPGFTLFETMLFQGGRVAPLEWHLARLARSAQDLGFACDLPRIRSAIAASTRALAPEANWRLRLDLDHSGAVNMRHAALDALEPGRLRLVLADAPLPDAEMGLVRYKTSVRSSYDRAVQQALAVGAFDAVFVNRDGKVTEGGRSNLFAHIDGKWWTPPVACGLLPGVMRAHLLRHRSWFGERVIYPEELRTANALAVCNALRGFQLASLADMPAPPQTPALL